MNLQTYLALKAVVEADFEKLIFYQTVSDIDPPNYAVKSVGPAALISLTDAAAVPAESIKIDFEPIQEDEPEPPHSYSGSFVQFASKKQINAEDVLVNIEPVQDLHGYDHPWPAGGGKNMLPDITGARTVNSIYIGQADSTTYPIHLEANTAYSVSVTANSGAIGVQVYIKENGGSNIVFANGASGTYTPTQNMNVQMWVYAEGLTSVSQFQLEKGSTPTAWTPYSNICPISGWTGAKVTRTGKNIITNEKCAVQNLIYLGTQTGNGDNTHSITLPSGEYTLSVETSDGENTNLYIAKVGDSNYLKRQTNTKSITFTLSETLDLRIWAYKSNYSSLGVGAINSFQLEIGSTATAYEPYQGDTYDITFPSEAGTVYGGTLDVVNGVLTVDRAMVDLGTLNWEYISRFNCYCSYLTSTRGQQEAKIMFDALCSNYPFVGAYNNLVDKSCSYIYNQAIAVKDSAYADTAAFKTAMSGVQLCYELATPVTYQLTPQQVALLRGNNTIWADTGDVTIDVSAVPAPISGRTGLKLYHSGSTQNMPDLVEVDWENELGTVYGGTLDIVSGVLTVDRATETITKDSPFYSFSVGTVNAIASVDFTSGAPLYVSDISSYNGAISSTFVELQNYWTSGRNNETPAANYGFAYNSSGRCCFRIVDTSITTLAEFKAAFPDTQICYKLATPINRHLSSTQVNMLLGANTLWSDDGNITLVYKAKK